MLAVIGLPEQKKKRIEINGVEKDGETEKYTRSKGNFRENYFCSVRIYVSIRESIITIMCYMADYLICTLCFIIKVGRFD